MATSDTDGLGFGGNNTLDKVPRLQEKQEDHEERSEMFGASTNLTFSLKTSEREKAAEVARNSNNVEAVIRTQHALQRTKERGSGSPGNYLVVSRPTTPEVPSH